MYERTDPLTVIAPAPEGPGRGVLVCGAPRGGTSMAAGVLRIIGADMGARQGEGNNEDLDIQEARGPVDRLGDPGSDDYAAALARMRPVIGRRAQTRGAWGWKDPHAALYARDVLDGLPAPRLVVVTRDPAAAAMRTAMLTGMPVAEALADALALLARAAEILAAPPCPAALVSYEKALVRPGRFVEQIAAFCGLSPDDAQAKEAAAFISPERGHGAPHLPGWPRQGAL
ncbi:MAG: sulfotransferase [Maricaulaceae bacterium]|nr:sulfotransferase [Maricaulaceae bacterium]